MFANAFSGIHSWLFLRFFIRSYTTRLSKSPDRQRKPIVTRSRAVVGASEDAARDTDKLIEKVGGRAERVMGDLGDEVRRDLASLRQGLQNSKTKDRIQALEERTKDMSDKTIQGLRQRMSEVGPNGSVEERMKKAEEFVTETVKKGEETILANGGKMMDGLQRQLGKAGIYGDRQAETENEESRGGGRSQDERKGSGADTTSRSELAEEKPNVDGQPHTQAGGEQSGQPSYSGAQENDSKKENESPVPSQTNGDTQAGSMETSQTVSDLDGSFADVVKGDSEPTKSPKESNKGEP